MQCYNFEGGRGWEWWNERGIEGAAPTEREEIQWVVGGAMESGGWVGPLETRDRLGGPAKGALVEG